MPAIDSVMVSKADHLRIESTTDPSVSTSSTSTE
jgi:hypothetical protein